VSEINRSRKIKTERINVLALVKGHFQESFEWEECRKWQIKHILKEQSV
jgi:hypothetical protein